VQANLHGSKKEEEEKILNRTKVHKTACMHTINQSITRKLKMKERKGFS
jgi:hypothetical protein